MILFISLFAASSSFPLLIDIMDVDTLLGMGPKHKKEDDRFNTLSRDVLTRNLDAVNELDIDSVLDIIVQDIVGNGIHREFANERRLIQGDMNELPAISVKTDRDHMIYENHMITCLADAVRNVIANGFAFVSAITNPDENEREACPRIPIVLDIRQITVRYFRDVCLPHFLIYDGKPMEKSKANDNSTIRLYGTPIEDFIILGDRNRFPTYRLEIQSVIQSLFNEDIVYKSKVACTLVSDLRRANPIGVLTKEKDPINDKHDVEVLIPAMEKGKTLTTDEHLNLLHNQGLAASAQAQEQMNVVAERNMQCGTLKANGGSMDRDMKQARTARGENRNRGEDGNEDDMKVSPFIPLEPGQNYTATAMADSPTDLLSHRQSKREAVCIRLSIPMSLISSGDATGKAKLNTQGASPDHLRIFKEAQKGRRREYERWLNKINTQMYTLESMNCGYVIPGPQEAAHLQKPNSDASKQEMDDYNTLSEKKMKYEKLKELADCIITINPNPHNDDVINAYEKGFMPYGSAAQNLSRGWGIPTQQMSRKGKITSRELAGIISDDEDSGKPPKKKAKKKN